LLKNNNPWLHRTALRLLRERLDNSVSRALREMLLNSDRDEVALRALWGLYAIGEFDPLEIPPIALKHKSPWVRAWGLRLNGQLGADTTWDWEELRQLIKKEAAPEVRLQLACSCQQMGLATRLAILAELMKHKEDAHDPCIPLMIWLALEPSVAPGAADVLNSAHVLNMLLASGGNDLIADYLVPRAM